jgi:hypothetical protein
MNEMRAVQYDVYGPPEVLRVAVVPVPSLRPGHVLVRAAASSVNAADVLVRSGKLKLVSGRSFPRGSGFDFTGDVVAVADDVTTVSAGDEVVDYRKLDPAGLGTFDVILDPVSLDMPSYQRLLRPGGRMGALGASRPAQLASIAASAIHGSRRIRLIQAPPGHGPAGRAG